MAAGAKIGTAYIDVGGDFGRFNRQVDARLARLSQQFKGVNDSAFDDRVRTRTRAFGDEVDRVSRRASGMNSQISTANRNFMFLRNAMKVVAPAALVSGLGLAAQGLSAAGAGAFALGAALAPLVGLGASAGAGLVAAAQGAAVFKLATFGIADALKEQVDRSTQAASNAVSTASAQRAAARAVQSAQESVRNATVRLSDAQRNARSVQGELSAARRQAARDLADLAARTANAYLTEQRALLGLEDARDRLNRLTNPDALDVGDAEDRVSDAERNQQRATQALTETQREARQILNSSSTSAEQKAKASLDLADAENAVADAAREIERAQRDLNKVKSPDPREIAKAQLDVRDAELAVSDAQRERATIQVDLNEATTRGIEGSRAVLDAQQRITDSNRSLRDAQRELRTAMQSVTDAQLAQSEAATRAGIASGRLDKAMSKLPPAAQAFVRQLVALKPRFDELRATAATGLFPGVSAGLTAATRNFEPLKNVVALTASALGDLARQAGELVGSRGFGRDLQVVGAGNAKVIASVGRAVLNLVTAFRHILVAAQPLTLWLAHSTEKWTENLAATARAGRESGRLAGFFDKTRAVMERLSSIGGSLASAFYEIGKAAAPLGGSILAAIDRSAQRFEDWTKSASGKNQLAEYFKNAKEPIFELGALVGEITKAFFRLGNQPGVAELLRQVRTQLVPAIEQLIGHMNKAFGPVLVNTLTQIVKLFTGLMGASGPLTLFVRGIGEIAGLGSKLLNSSSVMRTFATSALTLFAVFKAAKLLSVVSGLSAMSTAVTGAAGAYRALAAGQSAATVAQNKGVAATIAAKVAHYATAAATGTHAAISRVWAAVQAQNLGLLTATTLAAVRLKIATIASAVATKAQTAAQWLFNAAMTANPIGLVVVAIAALIAGLVLAYTKVDWFRNAVNKAWEVIKIGFNWVKDHWSLLLPIIAGPLGLAVVLIVKNFDTIKNVVVGVVTAVSDAASWLVGALSSAWNTIANIASAIWNGIGSAIKTAWDGYKAYINGVISGAGGIVSLIASIPGKIASFATNAFDKLIEGARNAKDAVLGVIGSIATAIRNAVADGTDFIGKIIETGEKIGKSLLNAVKSVFSSGDDFAKSIVNSIIKFINSKIIDWISEKKINMPSPIPDVTLPKIKHIPEFHTGTPFFSPSPADSFGRSDEGLALLKRGESVMAPGALKKLVAGKLDLSDGAVTAASGGGDVNMYGPVTIGSHRSAEVLANRLAYRTQFG